MSQHKVVLIGGPYDGQGVTLSELPEEVEMAGVRYRLIRDPDTREPLGGYAVVRDELL